MNCFLLGLIGGFSAIIIVEFTKYFLDDDDNEEDIDSDF